MKRVLAPPLAVVWSGFLVTAFDAFYPSASLTLLVRPACQDALRGSVGSRPCEPAEAHFCVHGPRPRAYHASYHLPTHASDGHDRRSTQRIKDGRVITSKQHPLSHDTFIMRTTFALTSVLAVASGALAAFCPDAARFGNSVVIASSTKPLVAGDVRAALLGDATNLTRTRRRSKSQPTTRARRSTASSRTGRTTRSVYTRTTTGTRPSTGSHASTTRRRSALSLSRYASRSHVRIVTEC